MMNRKLLTAITLSPVAGLVTGVFVNWLFGIFGFTSGILFDFLNGAMMYYATMAFVLPSAIAFWMLAGKTPILRLKLWSKVASVPLILAHFFGPLRWMFESGRCWKYPCSFAEFMTEPLFGAGVMFFGSVIWYYLVVVVVSIVIVVKAKLFLIEFPDFIQQDG